MEKMIINNGVKYSEYEGYKTFFIITTEDEAKKLEFFGIITYNEYKTFNISNNVRIESLPYGFKIINNEE